MNKCRKIICLVLAVVMMLGTFALSAMTATGDTDNKIYAFKFNEDDYKPGMATNPADSYYTENDGTLVLESNEIHKQYQMFFAVNEKNASRLEEAIITACRYYDGVLATEVHIPWAKNKWGYNCSPEIGITFMNSKQKTVCKADITRYAPDTMEPHQVLMDVTTFIDPETGDVNYSSENAIKFVYVQIQCYDWGCGSGDPDGGTRGKYTVSPFYVVTGKEEVNTIPTSEPDPNQQTLLNFGKANKRDYDNAPSSRKYSADGVVWKSEGMATAENAGFLEMKQINTFNQMQVNYAFEHGDALKNAFNLAKSENGTGYAKFTVNIVQCLDYNTRKDMIAEIKFAVAQSAESEAQYQEFTAWQYPGTSRTYYIDLTRYRAYQELSSMSVAIQNYWHVKTNPDGTKEIFDYDREINWDQSLDRSEELGYVRTYLFNTTVIVSPVVVIPKTAEANHTFKNTDSKIVLNKFNTDSCVVPATKEEKVNIDPNADGYTGKVEPTTKPGSTSGSGGSTTKIAAPKVSSAAVVGKNQIKVKYGKVSGAKYYQLYRKVNTGSWKKIKTVSSKYLTITDKTASAAGTYQYKVRAVDAKGGVSKDSNIKKVTGVMSFSAKPTIKLASIKKGVKVTLSKKVTNAGGYQIQYSKKKTMKSAKTTTMKKTAKYKNVTKLTAKTRYYVRVRAYKVIAGKKQYGKWSTIKYVTTKK